METPILGSTTTPPDPPSFVQRCSETTLLQAEIIRLRLENEDLRASAEWWLYLYEAALARANELAATALRTSTTRDGL